MAATAHQINIGMETASQQQKVILIHGLWMNGSEMKLLGRRLRRHGYQVDHFRYPTVRCDMSENSDALWQYLSKQCALEMASDSAGSVHLVCHSLGGVVALTMLARYPELPVARMVALGSPFHGSLTAQHLTRWRSGRLFLGKSMNHALDGGGPSRVPLGREVGIIAGSRSLGISDFLWPLPNDGTVAVIETQLPGAVHTTLPLVHMGLVTSRRVPPLVDVFLRTGHF